MNKKMGFGRFISKYRDIILFNKNLLIASVGGFFSSAYVSYLHFQYDNNEVVNSSLALIADYAAYLPLFALLFYLDNKKRYVDPLTGKKNTAQIMQDIKKLVASFSFSEVIYSATRFLAQYQLLHTSTIQAHEASMISTVIAWAVFFVAINLMVKLVRLYKKSNPS